MSNFAIKGRALTVLTLIYVIAIIGGGWGLLVQPIDNLRWAVESSVAVTDPSEVVMILSSIVGMAALVLVSVALGTSVANSMVRRSPNGSRPPKGNEGMAPIVAYQGESRVAETRPL
jgi:hypothetical protein